MPTPSRVREQVASAEQAAAASDTPAGQALARQQSVNDLLVTPRIRESIAQSLPNMITPERFTRLIMTAMRGSPQLAQCDPMSVIAAAVQSAQLGLEPGPLQQAYLVPYYNSKRRVYEAQFQIGYRGYVELANRSGVVMEAWPVHRGEEFAYGRGSGANKFLRHVPAIENRGDVYCYYAIAEWQAGAMQASVFEVMNIAEIEHNRDTYSKMADRGAWVDNFDAMACKTVCRALIRWVPKAVELQRALAADETVRTEISDNMADDAWAAQEQQHAADRAAPPAPAADVPPPTTGKCPVCNFDLPEHADGCDFEDPTDE